MLGVAGGILMVGGLVTCLLGALGLLRLQGVYARTHAAGVVDTLGAALVLAGLMLQAADAQTFLKLALALVLILLTGPVACHAVVQAARHGGVRPILHGGTEPPPLPDDTP